MKLFKKKKIISIRECVAGQEAREVTYSKQRLKHFICNILVTKFYPSGMNPLTLVTCGDKETIGKVCLVQTLRFLSMLEKHLYADMLCRARAKDTPSRYERF